MLGLGPCAQFDGAARGNPEGPAFWGVALWWGRWKLRGFEPEGLREEHARPIGSASNNKTEYLGCAFALELVIQRMLSMSQHASRLAHQQ